MKILGENTVFRSPNANAFHPSVSCVDANHWVVTHDLGQTVDALDYHTQLLRTRDGGLTWEYGGRVLPEMPGTTHTLRTRRFRDGRLLGFGKLEQREGYPCRCNPETLGQVPMRLFWIESTDHGQSWTRPTFIEPALEGPTWELCHPLVELPGGLWGAPVATWRDWEGRLPNGEQTGILFSHNKGQSWPGYVCTFDGRREGIKHWEQSVVTLDDGLVLATAWVYDPSSGRTLPSVFTTSQDGGRSFSPSCETGFLAQTCKLLPLPEGRVLAAYRRHDEPGLWLELAEVGPGRWKRLQRLPLWTGNASGMLSGENAATALRALRFGYPSMAMIDDKRVLLVYWRSEEERSVIHAVQVAWE